MSDELKEFLHRELEEIKQNKVRVAAIGVCLVVLIGVWLTDDSPRGEEVDLNTAPVDKPPATKDLPAKPLPVPQSVEGVTPVLGANADVLAIADPFAGVDKPKPPPQPVAPVTFQPPPIIPQPPQEKVTLTGTALGEFKTAMFLRGKQTIFLTIGDEINGRQIVDITADFVAFDDGSRLFVQKADNWLTVKHSADFVTFDDGSRLLVQKADNWLTVKHSADFVTFDDGSRLFVQRADNWLTVKHSADFVTFDDGSRLFVQKADN